MTSATEQIASSGTAGTIVVVQGVNTSLDVHNSLLSASVEQIMKGDFVLTGSDVTTLVGSLFLVLNFTIAYIRWRQDRYVKTN